MNSIWLVRTMSMSSRSRMGSCCSRNLTSTTWHRSRSRLGGGNENERYSYILPGIVVMKSIRHYSSMDGGSSLWRRMMMMMYHDNTSTRQRIIEAFVLRCQRNIKRLYARRILEMLAATAATYYAMGGGEAKAKDNSSSSSMFHEWFGSSRKNTCFHPPTTLMEQQQTIATPTEWQNYVEKDWTDELIQSVGTSKVQRFIKATTRMITLGTLFSPLILLFPLSEYVSSKLFQPMAWNYAIWSIEQAGPTLIKLIQWATTRQDMFSQQFCSHFGKLRDETTGHPWKETERLLKNDIGDNYADYLYIDPKQPPIGSGCIAQVYRGKLQQGTVKHPKGTKVAIKVQHPGIWEKVCMDFYILGKAAKLLEALPVLNLQYLALQDTVQQFRNVMLPQLDLTLEAKHLNRFNRDFGNDDHVSFPHPISELTTKHVLTETFVHGVPILEYVDAPQHVREQLAVLGIKTTLKMIFLNDFLHGDLHPGNILVSEHDYNDHDGLQLNYDDDDDDDHDDNDHHHDHKDKDHQDPQQTDKKRTKTSTMTYIGHTINSLYYQLSDAVNYASTIIDAITTLRPSNHQEEEKIRQEQEQERKRRRQQLGQKNKKLRLHLLDCGLVLEMGPNQHVNLVRILGAFTRRDGKLAGQLMVDTSRNSKYASSVDIELFIDGIHQICMDDEQENFLEKIGDYIADICFLACKHKVKLEGAFVNAALAVEIMEGIGQSIYPQLHVQGIALPIIMQAEMMHRFANSLPW